MNRRDLLLLKTGSGTKVYELACERLYMRLLDATADGANWTEIVAVLFGLDPARDPDRSRLVYASHLVRAQWMSQAGFRRLLGDGPPPQ